MTNQYPEIFISYRNIPLSKIVGQTIHDKLVAEGYSVFFDYERLKNDGGAKWAEVLENNAAHCTVVLVLVEEKTGESEWVKKEITTVRTNGGAVVPIVVDEEDQIGDVLDVLEISELQYLLFDGTDEHRFNHILSTVADRIREVNKLRERQQTWKQGVTTAYTHSDQPQLTFCLVSDDATRLDGYDVLVNTENNYMQMARHFESNTLSSQIRLKGSLVEDDYIFDDYVQNQLYTQIVYGTRTRCLPVRSGNIIVTEAGHPESELRKNFRYLFHAAAVNVDRYERRITPMSPQGIPLLIGKCLKKLDEINQNGGQAIYNNQSELEPAPEGFTPIESIVFPLFGTGAGTSASDSKETIADKIIEGVQNHLRDLHADSALRKVGLCIYMPEDAHEIENAGLFEKHGFIRQD